MKLDLSRVTQGCAGTAFIACESPDDYQKLSVVIKTDDIIHCKIRRKTDRGNKTDISIVEADIRIKEVEYQAGVDEMRLRGVLEEGIDGAPEGSHQRVMLCNTNNQFSLYKNEWTEDDIEILKSAAEEEQNHLIIVLFTNQGATILSEKMKVLSTIKQFKKQTLFASVAQYISTNSKDLKCVVVFSPNAYNTEFIQYIRQNAQQVNARDLCKNNAFIDVKVTNGSISEVEEQMRDENLTKRIEALVESDYIQAYNNMMNIFDNDCDKVAFGEKDFRKALNYGAIDTLFVTDTYIENLVQKRRQGFMKIMNYLKSTGSKVVVFPHTVKNTHDELEKVSGLAATLRFKINQ